jgi:ribosomal protein S13
VDVAGEKTESGSLKSKRGKGKKTAQSIMDKLDESISVKPEKLNEEFERIQTLMGYKKKTQ